MIDCKVCCKICEQTLCRYAGAQRGLEVDCRYYVPRQKPQTNADRIRAMSDEELGIFLAEWAEKPWAWKQDGEGECLAWLRQPVDLRKEENG